MIRKEWTQELDEADHTSPADKKQTKCSNTGAYPRQHIQTATASYPITDGEAGTQLAETTLAYTAYTGPC